MVVHMVITCIDDTEVMSADLHHSVGTRRVADELHTKLYMHMTLLEPRKGTPQLTKSSNTIFPYRRYHSQYMVSN